MRSSTTRVLITGASSGIGRATAHAYSSPNHELFLAARRRDRLLEVAEECRDRGADRVLLRCCDLSVPGQGKELVEACLSEMGGVEILVCNAGYGVYGPIGEVSPEEMLRIWQVNYQAAYESIHEVLPHMLEKGRGHIVLVSSVIGRKALPYAGAYCATKFAQVALGESLWGELKNTGVGISVICPGYTATEFQRSAVKTASLRSMRRLGGGQSPEVVAGAIVKAVRRKTREVHLTFSGRLLCGMSRLSPGLVNLIMAWVVGREQSGKK